MKNFWPQRPAAKGFSIERLARKYREKISITSFNRITDESLNDINLNSRQAEVKESLGNSLSEKKIHWANRDFSEYMDAA